MLIAGSVGCSCSAHARVVHRQGVVPGCSLVGWILPPPARVVHRRADLGGTLVPGIRGTLVGLGTGRDVVYIAMGPRAEVPDVTRGDGYACVRVVGRRLLVVFVHGRCLWVLQVQ